MATEAKTVNRNASGNGPANGRERIEYADLPPDWMLRIVNPLVSLLLRSSLHRVVSHRLMLLTVTGRTSGTEYTFPVIYEREGGAIRVTSQGTTWWKNLRDGGQVVTVLLEGERRTGRAEVMEDNRAVAEFVHDYLQRHGADAAERVELKLPDEEVPSVRTLESAVDHLVVVSIELHDS